MRHYLLLGIGLALASCAAQKALPQYTPEQQAAQRESIGFWQPDSAKAIPKLSPAAQRKLEARRRRGQAPAPLASDGGLRLLDSLVAIPLATPQPGRTTSFWQKVNPFRSKQPAQPLTQQATAPNIPRKCKGCTFNLVAGNQTVAGKKAQVAAGDGATATSIEKVKAPTAIGDSASATDNTKAGQRGGAAAIGRAASATATTEKAGFPWWVLAIPVVLYVGYRKFIAV